MKKKQSLINLLSCILVIMVIGIIINSNKFTSKYMTSNKYFNLLNSSVDTDDIVDLINNLKKSNSEKVTEVQALSDRVEALSSNTIGSADALNKIYPVGSIYISTNLDTPTKVASALGGGTWEVFGAGKVLRGTTDSNEVGTSNSATGSVTLATGNLPSHSHTMAHTHSVSTTTAANNRGHTHSVSGTTAANNVGHTHSVSGSTGNQSANHTHSFTINTSSRQCNLRIDNSWMSWCDNQISSGGAGDVFGGGTARPGYVEIPKLSGSAASAGAHVHNISVTSGGESQNHTHNINVTSGGISANHTHAFNVTSGASSQDNTSSTGKGSDIQAFSVIDPYITVYMYRRTA